ncbi:hypothetical protein A3K86_19260 [Photobacterium jeanii]|uniref:DUF2799 domain-containing protein n=1 Tax=Photobacterium jeanii TaxID=858640 RepID=A0A178K1F5_9GAMM|nr:hypothetical protein [Photobacterium jeanii]OAN11111.1 hypothetical protein A3K86_19260 [Photobacterium jeanii]PST90626.1 hypothetical protein C9I91_08360 [Photobacterium jeanii]
MQQTKAVWLVCAIAAVGLSGCTNSEMSNIDTGLDNYQFLPDEYDVETEYDSIYYYGFNQGCALKTYRDTSGRLPVSVDPTLEGRSSKYSDGVEAGKKACADGVPRTIPEYLSNNSSQ